ncbi:MAG: nucleotidyltransferase family protein, partial [Acidobacteria bacterium]|nr:nucleotidyltransferase family protein [Acidobacteriota bacterium]
MDKIVVQAMILAAGEGTRLRPLTLERPKPMLPIGGRPLLEHLILWLRDHAITHLAINLHYKPDSVRAYFGDGAPWGVAITYSLEDPILGTAGAVKKLQDYFADTFVVVYGDLLTNLDLTRLIMFHNAHKVPSVPSAPSGSSGP